MNIRTEYHDAPYRVFTRDEWAALREDTPMTLTAAEVERLHSLHDRLDIREVEEIYLPLSRLLSLYVAATQRLFRAEQRFLGTEESKVPYIIGVAGSVAVGKSTTARVLQALAGALVEHAEGRSLHHRRLPVSECGARARESDGAQGLSRELRSCRRCCNSSPDIKAGRRPVRAPIYSHLTYDIVPDKWVEVDRPDILIVEGLNVLQTGRLPRDGKAVPFVSDFFDFSVYLDADEAVLQQWYIERFLALRNTAFADPRSYFHRYASLSNEDATATAISIWSRINLANLRENILPTRPRATLILKKGLDHVVQTVALRRL